MENLHVLSAMFLRLARVLMQNSVVISMRTQLYRFRSLFGVSPNVCAIIWNELNVRYKLWDDSKPVHLLWALLFLKVYGTEAVNKTITGVDEKTYRKWTWRYVKLISELKLIKWNKRQIGLSIGNCRVSVDGTDVRIFEPFPFNPKWYSNKFKGPGLRSEVGVCISSGHIVWVNGPYPCGSHSDVLIFRRKMKRMLNPQEAVITDAGYPDSRCCTNNMLMGVDKKLHAEVRARHETVNLRLERFSVLRHRFRHSLSKHSYCFHAASNITQVFIESEEPLFKL